MVVMLSLCLFMVSCNDDEQGGGKEDLCDPEKEKCDAWDYRNDPARLKFELIYKLESLPKEGEAERAPWPDNWWPMRDEGIAQRWVYDDENLWDDARYGSYEPSPAEKYDFVFYPGQEREYEYKGKKAIMGPATLWEYQNHGTWQEDEVEGWWGHCNGWTAASICEPEPQHKVVRRVGNIDITFYPSDIKALLTELYFDALALGVGGRCNNKELERDEYGRIKANECRDINAGSFHVAVTNLIGIYKRAIAMDKSSGYQVWNYPVYKFKVEKLEEVDLSRALELLGVNNTNTYPYNEKAKRFAHVKTTLYYVTDGVPPSKTPYSSNIERYTYSASYEYLLEMDEGGKIIGGEWLGYSREDHPDFFWYPISHGLGDDRSDFGDNPYISYFDVKELLDEAISTTGGTSQFVEQRREVNLEIPDMDEKGIEDRVEVEQIGTVKSVMVEVNITHTYIGDLIVELEHDGLTKVLHRREGGSQRNLSKTYTVEEFVGEEVQGYWILRVKDIASKDIGTLNSWKLVIEYIEK